LETYYSLLGLEQDASEKDIKKAYRKMAMKYHPDRVNDLGEKIKTIAEIEFKRINIAKDILVERERRDEYDEKLRCGIKVEDGLSGLYSGTGDVRTQIDPERYDEEIARLTDTIENLKNIIISMQFGLSDRENELEFERTRWGECGKRIKLLKKELKRINELLSEVYKSDDDDIDWLI